MAPRSKKLDLGVFPAMLRILRVRNNCKTMADFADLLGLEHETYRRYERGEVEMNLAGLRRLRDRAGADLNEVICGTGGGGDKIRPFSGHIPAGDRPPGPRAGHEPSRAKNRA